jgi:hypothetical protein
MGKNQHEYKKAERMNRMYERRMVENSSAV